MENQTDICREILDEFRHRWTVDEVKQMTLDQYVSVGDKETFCQWLETRTRKLGSIKGINSSKFGVYKRRDKSKKPKRLHNDNEYSWQKFYSDNDRNEAFKKIRNEILQIIEFAGNGQWEQIDHLHLTQFVRWKIAYLYSNERLIPIFKKDVLVKIATHFGLAANRRTPISEIQTVMMENKPSHLSIYEYSEELYEKFGGDKKEKAKARESGGRRTSRRAATAKNTGAQTRRGATTYVATQKHNILQEALKNKLVAKFGKENVFMEKNFVDIKVVQPDKIHLYEVKSSAYASDCVREALGQILSYAHKDSDRRPKQLIIAGQYKPNDDEVEFINFVKKNLNLNFSYESVDL
jgi:hypothetical protein